MRYFFVHFDFGSSIQGVSSAPIDPVITVRGQSVKFFFDYDGEENSLQLGLDVLSSGSSWTFYTSTRELDTDSGSYTTAQSKSHTVTVQPHAMLTIYNFDEEFDPTNHGIFVVMEFSYMLSSVFHYQCSSSALLAPTTYFLESL